MPQLHDCIVVGGGPSASIAAMLLARWGRDVVQTYDGHGIAHLFEETILDGAFQRMRELGLGALLTEAEWQGTPHHGVIWGSAELRVREQEDGRHPGLKVNRPTFDKRLRAEAALAGAKQHKGRVIALSGGRNPKVRLQGESLHASTIICCTGRRGTASLVPLQEKVVGPPTIALTAVVASREGEDDITLIEAREEGWIWRLPRGDGQIAVTLFADLKPTRDENIATWQSAVLMSQAWAGRKFAIPNATTVFTPQLRVGPNDILLAGDAVSSADPLSSQGIEKAMFSAEEAAYAANTILGDGVPVGHLVRHLQQREQALFELHAAETGAWYSRETRFHDAPFWTARRRATNTGEAEPALPEIMQRASGVCEGEVFRRANRVLQRAIGWSTPRQRRPISHLGHIPLGPLLGILETPVDFETACDQARSHVELIQLRPSSFKEVLVELHRLGFIDAAPAPSLPNSQ